MKHSQHIAKVAFDDFTIDFAAGELLKSGTRIGLQEQPFQVLRILVQRQGEVVTREELRDALWPGNVVIDADDALSTAVRKVRQALGEGNYIETLPKRGYRFVGSLKSAKPNLWPRRLLLTGLAAGAGGLWYRIPETTPKILRYHELTQDGKPKDLALLTSDGKALYYGFDKKVWRLKPGDTPEVFAQGWVALSVGNSMLATRGDEDQELCSVGATVKRLGVKATAAAWAPDGNSYAYGWDDEVWHEGRRLGKLDGRILSLAWHPDGSRLRAGTRGNAGDSTWELTKDGKTPRKVFDHFAGGVWTQNGKWFLSGWVELQARRESDGKAYPLTSGLVEFGFPAVGPEPGKVYSIGNRKQGEVVQFDPSSSSFKRLAGDLSADGLAFSPDGKQIVYSSWPQRRLWVSGVDGSGAKPLTRDSMESIMPRWSPDGKRICFAARAKSADSMRIYQVSSEGGTVSELVPGEHNVANPDWTRDGNALVFGGAPWLAGFVRGSTSIRRLDLKTNQIKMIEGSEDLWSPKLSPDGRMIVAETLDLRKLMLYDEKWRQLIQHDRSIGYVWWSADSRWVYYNDDGPVAEGSRVMRVQVETGKAELVLDLKDLRLSHSLGSWFGLTPEGKLLFLRDTSRMDVYSMDLELA